MRNRAVVCVCLICRSQLARPNLSGEACAFLHQLKQPMPVRLLLTAVLSSIMTLGRRRPARFRLVACRAGGGTGQPKEAATRPDQDMGLMQHAALPVCQSSLGSPRSSFDFIGGQVVCGSLLACQSAHNCHPARTFHFNPVPGGVPSFTHSGRE